MHQHSGWCGTRGSEDYMGMADDQAPTRNKIQIRRVLCIGGPKDGKWLSTEEMGHELRILKPAKFDYKVISREAALAEEIRVPFPEYDVYFLERIALYGEGIWVGLHKDTMYEMDKNPPPGSGWRGAHTTMILRAILQRDVATEMGL